MQPSVSSVKKRYRRSFCDIGVFPEKRNWLIAAKLTRIEKRIVEKTSARLGISISELIRERLLRKDGGELQQ